MKKLLLATFFFFFCFSVNAQKKVFVLLSSTFSSHYVTNSSNDPYNVSTNTPKRHVVVIDREKDIVSIINDIQRLELFITEVSKIESENLIVFRLKDNKTSTHYTIVFPKNLSSVKLQRKEQGKDTYIEMFNVEEII